MFGNPRGNCGEIVGRFWFRIEVIGDWNMVGGGGNVGAWIPKCFCVWL